MSRNYHAFTRSVLLLALLVAGFPALATPEDDFVGPPLTTPNGCANDQAATIENVSRATGFSVADIQLGMRLRFLYLQDFCFMSPKRLQRAINKVKSQPKPDNPGEWAKFRAMEQADEHGVVKPDGLLRASGQREMLIAPDGMFVAGVRSTDWTALGPGNIGGRMGAPPPPSPPPA